MANFEKACILAENLNNIFSDNVFLVGPATGVACNSGHTVIGDHDLGMFVDQIPSSGDAVQSINDSALKSLVFREVFESRNINNRKVRAQTIRDNVDKMLPEHSIIVLVMDLNSENYRILGPTKGEAVFTEAEFRYKIVIALA